MYKQLREEVRGDVGILGGGGKSLHAEEQPCKCPGVELGGTPQCSLAVLKLQAGVSLLTLER